MKTILLTWWTWYIWSHWAVSLLEKWFEVIILDNLSNSNIEVLKNIEKITWKSPVFYSWDIRDENILDEVFSSNKIDCVIHFAWLKAVWESWQKPFEYYDNNIVWSLKLFEIMDDYDVKNIIFSSSATVYNPNKNPPFVETDYTWETTNPYWTTKFILENILRDLANFKWFNVVNLRYFNPIWAHSSWLIWEDPNGIPNNLLPYVMKVVSWELESVWVFWNDYETSDWTGERDYIHVVDLIEWHIKSIEFIEKSQKNWFFEVFNLWTWKPTSVLEIIKTTSEIVWFDLKYNILPRRDWDLAKSFCNPKKARDILNWEAKFWIKKGIEDSYNFIKKKNNI